MVEQITNTSASGGGGRHKEKSVKRGGGSLDGLLDGAVGVVEHDGGVAALNLESKKDHLTAVSQQVVKLLEETELVTLLRFYDGGRARAEAVVVDSGKGTVVIGEFGADIDVEEVNFLAEGGIVIVLSTAVFFSIGVVVVIGEIIGRHGGEMTMVVVVVGESGGEGRIGILEVGDESAKK
ncbi:hypothetical protein L1987_43567 [Smallanthus sonchifolius]|uniref:Uncharacterized protein n=1 Tax=Smallanthus sonchifolius TaxID=185202 RepID=A0ACB9GMR9_9ASTR|nr:hypothetical protein L1987_43567 [Smallanthus sonchifolius]